MTAPHLTRRRRRPPFAWSPLRAALKVLGRPAPVESKSWAATAEVEVVSRQVPGGDRWIYEMDASA